jgi:hypothetical protein
MSNTSLEFSSIQSSREVAIATATAAAQELVASVIAKYAVHGIKTYVRNTNQFDGGLNYSIELNIDAGAGVLEAPLAQKKKIIDEVLLTHSLDLAEGSHYSAGLRTKVLEVFVTTKKWSSSTFVVEAFNYDADSKDERNRSKFRTLEVDLKQEVKIDNNAQAFISWANRSLKNVQTAAQKVERGLAIVKGIEDFQNSVAHFDWYHRPVTSNYLTHQNVAKGVVNEAFNLTFKVENVEEARRLVEAFKALKS